MLWTRLDSLRSTRWQCASSVLAMQEVFLFFFPFILRIQWEVISGRYALGCPTYKNSGLCYCTSLYVGGYY